MPEIPWWNPDGGVDLASQIVYAIVMLVVAWLGGRSLNNLHKKVDKTEQGVRTTVRQVQNDHPPDDNLRDKIDTLASKEDLKSFKTELDDFKKETVKSRDVFQTDMKDSLRQEREDRKEADQLLRESVAQGFADMKAELRKLAEKVA